MGIIIRSLIAIIVLIVSTVLFHFAADSLKIKRLNMISTIYYFILVFSLIGGSLVFIGLRKHYLIQKITQQSTINKTYFFLAYCVIVFPLVLIIMKKIINKFFQPKSMGDYISGGINYNSNMVQIQGFVVILMAVCTLATAYVFMNLGYIPFLSIIKGDDLNVLRQSGSRFFQGNQYIKNLFMTTLTPFVSYLTYIYFRFTHSKKWALMFIYMALLSVVVLTYDFSKSPIITYLLGLYLLEVMIGNINSNKWFSRLVIAAAVMILFFYLVMMNTGSSIFSIYTGPVGRILFTQIATLFLHIDAFPANHAFLDGASFNSWMSFFIPLADGTRSGRVVMTIYNSRGVQDGTAGVMNTIFIGESYANFGTIGVLIAPVIFGIIIGLFAYLLPNLKKTPASILLYAQFTLLFVTIVEGGFVDIFYTASSVFVIAITFFIYFITGMSDQKYNTKLSKLRFFYRKRVTTKK